MVDTEERLAAFLPAVRAAQWVALDTEADSLHAYPEKVCLIQIGTVSGDRLIDPLAGINLSPLLDALAGRELLMHGADYDLRLLRKHHEFVPGSIFDTMLAARLLGYWQFGLERPRQQVPRRQAKGPQKANWALRPLTERMENFTPATTPTISSRWPTGSGRNSRGGRSAGTRNPARGSSPRDAGGTSDLTPFGASSAPFARPPGAGILREPPQRRMPRRWPPTSLPSSCSVTGGNRRRGRCFRPWSRSCPGT